MTKKKESKVIESNGHEVYKTTYYGTAAQKKESDAVIEAVLKRRRAAQKVKRK